MSANEIDSESSESEIDENDALAPQLHYIRMQKRLKKKYEKEHYWSTKMKKCWNLVCDYQRIFRFMIIFGILGFLIYSNSGNFKNVNKNMNKNFSDKFKSEDFEDEDAETSMAWISGFLVEMFEANFSWFAIKEMSYWIGLTIFGLVGYGFFCRLNHNLDMKELEIRKKLEEEQRLKNNQERENKETDKNGESEKEIINSEIINEEEMKNNLNFIKNKTND